MAKVIQKTVGANTDKIVILGTRESLSQPFDADGWTDLRVGFFLSVCSASVDDPPSPITGLTETIAGPYHVFNDRVAVGISNNSLISFIGFCNVGAGSGGSTTGDTELVISDLGTAAINQYYWRYKNGLNDAWTGQIIDHQRAIAQTADGSEMHLVQDTVGAGAPKNG